MAICKFLMSENIENQWSPPGTLLLAEENPAIRPSWTSSPGRLHVSVPFPLPAAQLTVNVPCASSVQCCTGLACHPPCQALPRPVHLCSPRAETAGEPLRFHPFFKKSATMYLFINWRQFLVTISPSASASVWSVLHSPGAKELGNDWWEV